MASQLAGKMQQHFMYMLAYHWTACVQTCRKTANKLII